MPQGGLSMFGAGLQLQQATPGTTSTGNFNVSGVGIAQRGLSTTTNINGTESIGHALPNPSSYGNNNNVFLGAQVNTGTGLAGPFVGIGSGVRTSGQGCVAVGLGVLAGPAASNGLPNWVFGHNSTAGSSVGSNGYNLSIGWTCSAEGGQNIAIGKNVTCNTTNTGNEDAIGVGSAITAGITATRNLLIGRGVAPGTTASRANLLAIGWFDPTVGDYPVGGPGALDNSILIGNAAQTNVKIGPYTIGAGAPGSHRSIADVDAAVAATDGTIAYASITAARIVSLPAANAVPAGFRVLIVDDSGAASAVNTITINRAGADTINGAAAAVINSAYGCRELKSDGASKWTIIRSI